MPPRKRKADAEPAATAAAAAAATAADSAPPQIFEDLVVVFGPGIDESFATDVEARGATVARNITKKTTHYVVTQAEFDAGSAKVTSAQKNSTLLVLPAFVVDSIKAGKLQDAAAYAPKQAAAAAAAAAAPVTPTAASSSAATAADVQAPDAAPVGAKRKGRGAKAAADVPAASDAKKVKADPDTKKKDDAAAATTTAATAAAAAAAAAAVAAPAAAAAAAAPPPAKTQKIAVKGRAAVDPLSRMAGGCHVLEQGDDVYDVMLNQTNIDMNNNKFYVIQVLESDAGGKWWLWNRWGRVGLDGQNKLMPMPSKEAAVAGFKAKYREKTKNDWEQRKNFKHVPGYYEPVEMDYSAAAEAEKAATAAATAVVPRPPPRRIPESRLHPRLQNFIQLICDVRMMEQSMVQFELDTERMPLGKISKAQILKGFSILQEIATAINQKASGSVLAQLSSRFYTAIPHSFGMRTPPVIGSDKLVQDKLDMLQALGDLEIAATMLKSAEADLDHNPIDVHHDKLKCRFEPLEPDSDEFRMVEKYVRQTHGSTHGNFSLVLEDVFRIEREGEVERYSPFSKLHNKRLLWHGSGLANWVGILSQGLRIAPPEAPVTGYMFGKGVYFADMVSKSANYCRTSKHNPTGVMLLSEVALGDMNQLLHAQYMEKPPKGTHSTFGMGRFAPDPTDTYTLDGDVLVPYGRQVDQKLPGPTSLMYNEFIVYNTAQIRMRYVLRLTFKHKY